MIRSYALAAAAGLAALTSINAFAADPLPTETHKVLTADLAVEAAQAAIAACKAQGYAVSVVIADRTGMPKLVIVRDGPRGVGPEVARRKAYTAAVLRVSTGDFTKRVATPGAFNPGMYDKELSTGEGGVPIKVGDDTIGGIATAGAPGGDKDEACAIAGLNKIKDQLK
ncbi:MAG TPA: heme-binding protein [Xanthobacteraceae bacterium]